MDDRDWGWLGPDAAPVATGLVERVLWRVVKDTRAAEARVRLLGHGSELMITVGAELLMTRLYRDGEAAELAVMSTGIRQTFEGKGWQLQPADEPEREAALALAAMPLQVASAWGGTAGAHAP